ncbi:HNH endonuclease signature motif containing protein [Methylobacterium oryzisoli]|uniref:HNH endonuclease signature motif containing protein n=1 Tax=Methylobacterium oryzisoli TaxID=3385502 RepID=UPI00389235C4
MASTNPETAPARFDAKWIGEPNSGCWLWTGGVHGNGYGSFHDGERVVGAHHYAYRRHSGPIPKGRYVCHRCDTPTCVNPDHLFIDTPSGNSQDMTRKKRNGNDHRRVYSDEMKLAIQEDTRPYKDIAEAYGLSLTVIKNLKSREGRGLGRPRIAKLEFENHQLREMLQRCIGFEPQLDQEIRALLDETARRTSAQRAR